MEHNRNYTRHPVALKVHVNTAAGWKECLTADISRIGLFIRMNEPTHPLGHVLQVRIELPGRRILELMARVRRVLTAPAPPPMAPGLGVEFFAISKELRDEWDKFVAQLKRPGPANFCEDSQDLRAMMPPKEVMDMLRKMREAGEIQTVPELPRPIQAAQPLPPALVPVQPTDTTKLAILAERVARGAPLFLRTPRLCQEQQAVHVAICHPDTDEEWFAESVVERVVRDENGAYAGVQVRFLPMGERDRRALGDFVRGLGLL